MFPVSPQRSASPIRIRRAELTYVDAFVRFILDHAAESGREGSPHFALSRYLVRDEVRSNAMARWCRPLNEPLWGRAFLLWAGAGVVGYVELRGGRIPAEMHRATLSMGVLRAFTGQGYGGRLIEVVVDWARKEAKLAFIDLGVFASNERAQKLYRKMGFQEQGRREDAFRLDSGVSVDDIQMSLDLR
jgi:ribosomal protein S18 acetylase RimI-like enzyme